MDKQTLKLGTHRGHRRIWLDNAKILNDTGFKVGARYDVTYQPDRVFIKLEKHPEGRRKVAKKKEVLPVIDINTASIAQVFPKQVERVEITYFPVEGAILIEPVK